MTITVNTSDLEIIRARAMAAGFGSLDTKRPDAWAVFGYPNELTFDRMKTAYDRGGAGHGAVHRLLDGCWQINPRIKQPEADEETPWEKKTKAVLTTIRGFAKLKDFDRRNMVGHYAALIYRVADNRKLSEEIGRAQRLVDIVPIYENQLRVTAWNTAENSENYGKPTMYQFRTRPELHGTDTQARPETWIDIHPSRVQIMAEGSVGDMFDGVPLLKPGYNSLVDIEKVSGGSAESYLKNSARTLTIEYAPGSETNIYDRKGNIIAPKEHHEEQVKALNRNIDGAIVTQGAKAGVLQTTTNDPTGAAYLPMYLFATSVGLSFAGLYGQRLGQLAGEQDKKSDQERFKGRQESELTPMIEEFVRRMQGVGVIEPGEFEVEWPDIAAPSDAEKIETLLKMTQALGNAFNAGIQELFDGDELRGVVNFKPSSDAVFVPPVKTKPTEKGSI